MRFKGFIIRNNFLLKMLTIRSFSAAGLTIFPFIFIENKKTHRLSLINHERIHIHQQLELLVFGFLILYFFEYIRNRFTMSAEKAYRSISFEREAYLHDHDLNYLNTRKPYAFLKYFRI